MEPLKKHNGIVVPFDRANVDTDLIIPKQFLKSVKRSGFGANLFDQLRYVDEGQPGMDNSKRPLQPDFILNQARYKNGTILLTRENFGCGSSREHAPWALLDYGFKVLVAPSFADIFYNNCFKNGILPIKINNIIVLELAEYSKRKEEIEINLERQEIKYGNKITNFEIDTFKKKCLIEGLDDIALSMEKISKIDDYEKKLQNTKPWVLNNGK